MLFFYRHYNGIPRGISDGNAHQLCTTKEDIVTNFDTVRDGDVRQSCATFEGKLADFSDAMLYGDTPQPCAALEGTWADACDAGRDGDAHQVRALECTRANARNALRDYNACQS